MYDPDPRSPVLRLGDGGTVFAKPAAQADRPAAQPTKQFHKLYDGFKRPTEQTDAQHLARLAQADPIAVRHSVGSAIHRLNTLAKADGFLARRIDQL